SLLEFSFPTDACKLLLLQSRQLRGSTLGSKAGIPPSNRKQERVIVKTMGARQRGTVGSLVA
ncbi:mCG65767, partial [Mus musculus]